MDERLKLWDVATGAKIEVTPELMTNFKRNIPYHSLTQGNELSLFNQNGKTLATLVSLPEAEQAVDGARPIEIGAKGPGEAGPEWFVTTPQGYFDCSANAVRYVKWYVNGQLVPAERYLRRFRRPDLVRQALRGEKINAPALTHDDVPPVAHFVGLKETGVKSGRVQVTLDCYGRHDIKELLLTVNGRPLSPVSAAPLENKTLVVRDGAKPIDIGAKPIDIGAKPIDIGAKPGGENAKGVEPDARFARRFVFDVPLPLGAKDIRLRATAYDVADLGSSPAEIALTDPTATPVPGRLLVLCLGVGQYQHGKAPNPNPSAPLAPLAPGQFSNLRFPALDAQAVANRLQAEGKPLYQSVLAHTLLDGQVTLANVRKELAWLQQTARPGQIDTVIVFMSGHGVSDAKGRYYFPMWDFAPDRLHDTSLSGQELQRELGGKLPAKSVFLFVDTCHSGALTGARSDDLTFDVMNSGVYMMASSGATQYSYESPSWGHGAFTSALLTSLSKRELARDGMILFNTLSYAVPDEIARLLLAAGQSAGLEEPVIPLDGRTLTVPVAQPRASEK